MLKKKDFVVFYKIKYQINKFIYWKKDLKENLYI